jgi:catechol 2,3-dioxygenase-like lactoylglutathione lyase family enzyme
MDTQLSLSRIGQVSLLCRSAVAAEAWYRDVLGLHHLYSFGPLAFFDCGGTRIFVREVAATEWRASSTLYFAVDDITAAYAVLVARGVHFSEQPSLMHRHESGDEEWMAFFADPDGNVLALMALVAK